MAISDLVQKASDSFQAQGLIKADDAEIFKYYFEFVLSMGLVSMTILLLSMITHTTLATVIYLGVFFLFRSACGGYHAASYSRCFITSILSYGIFVLLLKSIPSGLYTVEACIVAGLLVNLAILLMAPVEHPNKPFSASDKIQYRVKSVVYLFLFDLAILSVLILTQAYNDLALAAVLGAVQSALAVSIVYILRWKEGVL